MSYFIERFINEGGIVSIFFILIGMGLVKLLADTLKLKGARKGAPKKQIRLIGGIGSIILLAISILYIKEATLPWLLDIPYMLSGGEPYYYGETIGNYERGGDAGVKNTETGEILYVNDWLTRNRDKGDFRQYGIEEGTYVEIVYLPHTRLYGLVSEREEAEFNEIIRGDEHTLEKANEKTEVYGVITGVFCLFLSSSWSAWYVLRRLKRRRITEESKEIILLGGVDALSILLAGTPLIIASMVFIGSWTAPLPMKESSQMIWICMLLWIIGVLLDAVPYHTMLLLEEEEFYIGASKYLQRRYQKSEIQSVERTKGSVFEIVMKNGKKIRGRAEKEGFEIIRKKLLEKEE